MKKTRNSIFETNSSSTHSLSLLKNELDHYIPEGKSLIIEFIDSDDYYSLSTLKEKVSYLVSHIINKYQYNSYDYDELVENVENDEEFKVLKDYIKQNYNKELKLPKKYEYDLECITELNHQLIEDSLEEVTNSILDHQYNDESLEKKLGKILLNGAVINIEFN